MYRDFNLPVNGHQPYLPPPLSYTYLTARGGIHSLLITGVFVLFRKLPVRFLRRVPFRVFYGFWKNRFTKNWSSWQSSPLPPDSWWVSPLWWWWYKCDWWHDWWEHRSRTHRSSSRRQAWIQSHLSVRRLRSAANCSATAEASDWQTSRPGTYIIHILHSGDVAALCVRV